MLTLRAPSPADEKAVMEYREEFLPEGIRISGSAGLESAESYSQWLYEGCDTHYGRVKEAVFLAYNEDDVLVGISDIRLEGNDFTEKYAGRLGYGIRKSQRGKGYAQEMFSLTLAEAKKLGFESIMVHTNIKNPTSKHILEKTGGIPSGTSDYHGLLIYKYRFDL